MMGMVVICLCAVGLAFCLYMLARNQSVFNARSAFINDPTLWPQAYNRLPPYGEMVNGFRHQLRWTKAHWVAYVKQQRGTQ